MATHQYDLDALARLARLSFDKSEHAALAQKLEGILDLVDELSAVPLPETLGALASLAPTPQGHTRPDAVTERDCRDEYLALAPAADEGHFLVPRVVE